MLTRLINNLRIGQRLTLGFGILLALIVILGGGALLLNVNQASAVTTLNESQNQSGLSASLKTYLIDAREEELTFLLRWRYDGFDTAYNDHVVANQQDTKAMHDLIAEFLAGETGDAELATLNQIDQQVTSYETTFSQVVDNIKVRGFVDTGLEGQFRAAAHALESAPQFTSNPELQIALLEMRRHEKDYFLRNDQTYLDQTREANAQLESQIGALNLSPIAAGTLLQQNASYLTFFNRVVDKDNEIEASRVQLEQVAGVVEPLVNGLLEKNQQEATDALDTYNSVQTTARGLQVAVPLVAVALGLGLALLIGRSITQPLTEISGVATGIGAGDFHRRSTVTGRNEVGVLAGIINKMAQQLQDFLERLEIRGKQLEARTLDLATTVETGRLASTFRSQDELLPNIVEFIRERFNLYYAQIYLVDEANRFAMLRSGSGEVGKQLMARKHRLDLSETSLVATAIQNRQPVLVGDTEKSAIHRKNPLLPNTRSEATIPLISGDEILGVLDMQANEAGRFNEDNLPVFEAMASQIASSISSAQANDEAQSAVQRAETAARRLTGDAWGSYLGTLSEKGRIGYRYDLETPVLLDSDHSLLDMAAEQEEANAVTRSISLRGQTIGTILVQEEGNREWTSEEVALIDDVARRVAQASEQLRSFEETQKRASEMETVAQVSATTATVLEVETMLQTVVDLTKERFNLYHAHVYLLDETGENLILAAGAGEAGQIMKTQGRSISLDHQNSLVARAARTGVGVVANDVNNEPNFLPNPLLPDTRAELAIPMITGAGIIGVLDVQSDQLNWFDDNDVRVKTTLAEQVAVAVQNARAFQAAQDAQAQTAAALTETEQLYSASEEINRAQSPDDVLKILVTATTLQHLDRVSIILFDAPWNEQRPEAGTFTAVWNRDSSVTAMPPGTSIPLGSIPAVNLVTRGEPLVINDTLSDSRLDKQSIAFLQQLHVRSLITLPMEAGGDWIGFLTTASTEPRNWEERDIRQISSLSGQAASVIQNIIALQRERGVVDRLRDVDRLKSQFLANMSHELRTPLNSIIGYSEVMLDGDDGELSSEAMEDVQTIHSSGQHLLSIINDILDLAKIEAGQMRIGREEVDLGKFATDVIHAGQVLVKEKPVTLNLVGNVALPHVYADPIRLRQIIWNLISNAVKFTEKGGVTVSLGMAENGQVFFKVEDTGIGMQKEDLPKIFEQFRQVDGSSTRRAGGTGLGLTITRLLIQMHGGDIHVESEAGVGSTFTFTLPAYEPEDLIETSLKAATN